MNISSKRVCASQQFFSPLGHVRCRALFGGYSLSIDDTVFAMVAEGELYLRAAEESAQYCTTHNPHLLKLNKRGREVLLNYYRVDEALWDDSDMLLLLSGYSLQAARREKAWQRDRRRLRDLPNLNFQLEQLLFEAGVTSPDVLYLLGAERCWLKMRGLRKELSVKVLFALEGAIAGVHAAALPTSRRQELTDWFNGLPAVFSPG
ncbi:regulator of competence-specific genes [Enterobacter sp. BIGb0383]|uniref:TfoX/Sxy family DNA transformation protein n=1 Tax=unclassified Enterobacter TaxID=2608935 RepID=UPI000F4633A0|nr:MULTISPECIES: TfoX/Sxy family DNA transformation protein [unclassified Enterobacter]ROP58932.1 regulator of competence-specific genes [Enterobacter sp. BIGb0383]ROS09602.1 regulator of competence-specific genes [Enterobacter sp. BIGb0359]